MSNPFGKSAFAGISSLFSVTMYCQPAASTVSAPTANAIATCRSSNAVEQVTIVYQKAELRPVHRVINREVSRFFVQSTRHSFIGEDRLVDRLGSLVEFRA